MNSGSCRKGRQFLSRPQRTIFPVRARFEGLECLFDFRQELANGFGLVLPSEMYGERVALVGGAKPSSAATVRNSESRGEARSRAQVFERAKSREAVFAPTKYSLGSRCHCSVLVEAEVRETFVPRTGFRPEWSCCRVRHSL